MVRYFLLNHISSFSKKFDVAVLSNYEEQSDILDVLPDNVLQINIPIIRDINLYEDIKALILLMLFFYRKKPLAVYSISPKGGVLSMVAAYFTRVPIRMHTFTGQVWVNKKGLIKWLLMFVDKVTSFAATTVFVDSKSQCDFIIQNRIVCKEKTIVLADGSISGVDFNRFYPAPTIREQVRAKMSTSQSSIIFLFVGRLKKDKGVFELINAFTKVSNQIDDSMLWFIGDDEDGIQNELEFLAQSRRCVVKFIPYTTEPEKYMQSADVFCLPSYREGFGSTIIEAAACGIPSIGTKIYGLTDAIVSDETGILVEKRDVKELSVAMLELASDYQLRMKMGAAARERAVDKFDANLVSQQLMKIVDKLVLDQ